MKLLTLLAVFLITLIPTHSIFAAPIDNMFTQERVIFNAQSKQQNISVALGTLKKINAQWITEKDISVDGVVSKKTVEVEQLNSPSKALAHIEKTIRQYNNRLLFACDGLTCGSSNAWANQRLGNKLLYGKDQTQAYRVWEVADANKNYLVATYTVQRGNRRIYAHIESILLSSPTVAKDIVPSPRAILQRIETYGFYEMGGLSINNSTILFDPLHVQALISALELKPFMRVTIVGHSFALGKEKNRQVKSLAFATQLQTQLTERGVKPHRLQVQGVGGLAPTNTIVPARVVIVKN